MKKLLSLALATTLALSALAMGALTVSADTAPSTAGAENITDKSSPYAFETPSEWADKGSPVGMIYNVGDEATRNGIKAVFDAGGYATVRIDDKNYKIDNYANSPSCDWLRFDVESKGATLLSGLTYDVSLYICDSSNAVKYFTDVKQILSGISTKNAPDRKAANVVIDLDSSNLTAAKLSYVDGTLQGLSPWGDGPATNLFDGDTVKTKIGGDCSGSTVSLEFKADKAFKADYYVFYTGGDTATNAGRNPSAWTLYGKSGDQWKVIDEVKATKTTVPGLGATNSTPYYYKVATPASYTEYKLELTTGGKFQMNEFQLLSGTATVIPDGIVANRYISTADQYIAFVNEVNEKVKTEENYLVGQTIAITADLDFSGKTVPMITKGKFLLEGCGKTLSNIKTTVAAEENGNYGLLASVMSNNNFNGTIQNLTLKNCTLTVTGEAANVNVGGVIGYADRARINSIKLDGVNIKVEGAANVGALIGFKQWQAADDNMTAITLKNTVVDAAKATVGIVAGKAEHINGTVSAVKGTLTVKAAANEVKKDTVFGTTGDDVTTTIDTATLAVTISDGTTPEAPKTGDVVVALSALALLSVAAVVTVSRKRKNEED